MESEGRSPLRILPHARITSEEFTSNSLLDPVPHCGRDNLPVEANPLVEMEPRDAKRRATICRPGGRPLVLRATRLLTIGKLACARLVVPVEKNPPPVQ